VACAEGCDTDQNGHYERWRFYSEHPHRSKSNEPAQFVSGADGDVVRKLAENRADTAPAYLCIGIAPTSNTYSQTPGTAVECPDCELGGKCS